MGSHKSAGRAPASAGRLVSKAALDLTRWSSGVPETCIRDENPGDAEAGGLGSVN